MLKKIFKTKRETEKRTWKKYIIRSAIKYYLGGQIKDNDIGGVVARSTH
jgi:hypothetical protein